MKKFTNKKYIDTIKTMKIEDGKIINNNSDIEIYIKGKKMRKSEKQISLKMIYDLVINLQENTTKFQESTTKRLDLIESDIKEIKQDIVELKQDVVELKKDVVELKQDVVELKNDMNILKSLPTIKKELAFKTK